MRSLFLALFILPAAAISQGNQTVSLSEILIKAKNAQSGDMLRYEGYQVITDDQGGLFAEQEDEININAAIQMVNCTFSNELNLINLHLPGLEIVNSRLVGINLEAIRSARLILENNSVDDAISVSGSIFQSLSVKDNKVGYEIYFENDSILNGDIYIEGNVINDGELDLIGIYSNGSVTIGNNDVTAVYIEDGYFKLPEYGEFNNYQLPGSRTKDLYLVSSQFEGDSTARVTFNKGSYLNLDLRSNTFNINVYFIENQVNDRLFFVDNQFNRFVSFEKFLFSEIWNEIYWDQLAGYKIRFVDYGAENDQELEDHVRFKNLINIYKGMHAIFLARGDLQSANACYSEMMQLQGRMLKHIYRESGGFGNYFRWQLNVLLKIYTKHGTDPALAVIVSLYVILIFAILYLFFPSEWDKESRERLLSNYEKMLKSEGKRSFKHTMLVAGSLILNFINAVTLSINSFVTLGFGSIPTKGLARYLCIIEGFIGWFLLSIFTVALINQVLV